jgi:hypothetical protein
MHLAALNGITHRIFRLAPGIFNLALCLLNHSFNLKLRIACQRTRFALGASRNFVDRSLHSILIHSSTSLERTLVDLINAQEYDSSAHTFLRVSVYTAFN